MLSPRNVFFACFKGIVFNVVTMGHAGHVIPPKGFYLHGLRDLFLMLLQWGMDCLVSNGAWLGLVSVNA